MNGLVVEDLVGSKKVVAGGVYFGWFEQAFFYIPHNCPFGGPGDGGEGGGSEE